MFKLKKKLHRNYKIIPFGTYCLPRVITTLCGLKPSKKDGEKTCPFDLAFFNSIDSNIELLDTKFNSFFDNIRFDNENHYWVNDYYNAILNHDGKLSKKELLIRYSKRINNLYEYLNYKNTHLYFLIATFSTVTIAQQKHLLQVIQKYRNSETFSLIIINQSQDKCPRYNDNIRIIDLSKDKTFYNINKNGMWAEKLKKQKGINAKIFYYKLKFALEKIIG